MANWKLQKMASWYWKCHIGIDNMSIQMCDAGSKDMWVHMCDQIQQWKKDNGQLLSWNRKYIFYRFGGRPQIFIHIFQQSLVHSKNISNRMWVKNYWLQIQIYHVTEVQQGQCHSFILLITMLLTCRVLIICTCTVFALHNLYFNAYMATDFSFSMWCSLTLILAAILPLLVSSAYDWNHWCISVMCAFP